MCITYFTILTVLLPTKYFKNFIHVLYRNKCVPFTRKLWIYVCMLIDFFVYPEIWWWFSWISEWSWARSIQASYFGLAEQAHNYNMSYKDHTTRLSHQRTQQIIYVIIILLFYKLYFATYNYCVSRYIVACIFMFLWCV